MPLPPSGFRTGSLKGESKPPDALSLAREGKDFYAELISRAVDPSPEDGIEI